GLAVPARREWTRGDVQRGQGLFGEVGCAACHLPKGQTGTLEGFPELSNQPIPPFPDLLLHDLGAELADGRPDFLASGSEWRTPPLWGLGLALSIRGELLLMHGGRGGGFAEAILWHGGDAEPSTRAFRALGKAERDAVLAFLGSL